MSGGLPVETAVFLEWGGVGWTIMGLEDVIAIEKKQQAESETK
jgi:hypothetical protein